MFLRMFNLFLNELLLMALWENDQMKNIVHYARNAVIMGLFILGVLKATLIVKNSFPILLKFVN